MNDLMPALKPATTAGPLKHKTLVHVWLKCLVAGLALLWNFPGMAAFPGISLTLAWYPSPSPDIAGYNVFSGGASGIYTNKVSAGNTTSVTLSNLVAGSTYYFVVTCYDNTGAESPPSNEAVYTVPADPTVPPVGLENPLLSGGGFSFTVPGGAGSNFAVEASVDLVSWVRVLTNTAPFTFVDTNASQFGKRFFRAVNLSNLAAANTAAQPVVLENPSLFGGNFSFTVPGAAGANFAVEASIDLVSWVRVLTNTAPFTFVDTNASQFGKRFFRAVKLP